MTQQLATIFGEVGLSQYLDIFLEQGFDTWETILDITESDLDALGVKLGHRRKLQRRIANSRGVPLEALLALPKQPIAQDPKFEPPSSTGHVLVKVETQEAAPPPATKRKYRRHPKPDENAPERPPSAYVLFSNKMREALKGRNLTFTEIAKLVGENWQNLNQAEKEPYESQAQAAKDRYSAQLAEYKKTPMYAKYMDYLHEFKIKHSQQSEREAAKRVKLSATAERGSSDRTWTRTSRSGSGSSVDDHNTTSEPFPDRNRRLGSVVSATDSQLSATPAMHRMSIDEAVFSPRSNHLIGRPPAERSPSIAASPADEALGTGGMVMGSGPGLAHRRGQAWHTEHRGDSNGGTHRVLPPLADMFEYRNAVNGSPPGLEGGHSKPPTLRKGESSAGSISSASSYSYPRTPVDGTLPIHALLVDKPQQHPSGGLPPYYGHPAPVLLHRQSTDGSPMSYANAYNTAPVRAGAQQSPPLPLPTPQTPNTVAQDQPSSTGVLHPSQPNPNLDGMSALLRAGEIVDGRKT